VFAQPLDTVSLRRFSTSVALWRMTTGAIPPVVTASSLLPPHSPSKAGGSIHLLQGPLRYYHYGIDGFADFGWGCGYRTVQSMFSWLSVGAPPSIPDIQEILARAHPDAYAGKRGWIGVADAVIILDVMLGAPLAVWDLKSGAEISRLLPELAVHFDTGGGPIMIGGGSDVYSKTLVGVFDGGCTHASALLIWDPHYPGKASLTSDVQELWDNGWVAWKSLDTLRADSFYNLGLVRRASSVGSVEPQCSSDAFSQAAQADWASQIEVVGSSCDARDEMSHTDWVSCIEVVGRGTCK